MTIKRAAFFAAIIVIVAGAIGLGIYQHAGNDGKLRVWNLYQGDFGNYAVEIVEADHGYSGMLEPFTWSSIGE